MCCIKKRVSVDTPAELAKQATSTNSRHFTHLKRSRDGHVTNMVGVRRRVNYITSVVIIHNRLWGVSACMHVS